MSTWTNIAGHSDQGSTTYTAMDTHTGELLAVSEWTLRWNKHSTEQTDMADYMKQVRLTEGKFTRTVVFALCTNPPLAAIISGCLVVFPILGSGM